MMKRPGLKGKFFIGMLVFGFVLAMGTAAQAVPALGVGTGTFDCTGATEYFECFTGHSASGSGESFSLTDGGEVHLWVNKDAYSTESIWLIGDSSFSSGFTFSVGGTDYSSAALGDVGSFDGYSTPYYGVEIGPVNGDWAAIAPGVFPNNPANDFFILSGTIAFDDAQVTAGNWLFIVAAAGSAPDGAPGGQDGFSPKTTSAVVPEPGTVLLLGSGLLGLILYRRKVQA